MADGTGRRTLSIAAAMVTAARAQWEQMGITPPVDVLDAFSSAAFSAAGVLMGHPNPRVAELESQLAEAAAERDALRAVVAEVHARLTAELVARRAAKEGTMRVRIAVAVASDGSWGAGGWCANGATVDDESAADVAHEGCERSDARLTWVEANVPLPTPDPVLTVEGKVTP